MLILNSFLGQYIWSLRRTSGSIVTLHFGNPYLQIREAISSSACSTAVQGKLSRRRVSPVGSLVIYCENCKWKIVDGDIAIADSNSSVDLIEDALKSMEGQLLIEITMSTDKKETFLHFDSNFNFIIYPDSEGVQWWAHEKDVGYFNLNNDFSYFVTDEEESNLLSGSVDHRISISHHTGV